jgi:hypothetical protein
MSEKHTVNWRDRAIAAERQLKGRREPVFDSNSFTVTDIEKTADVTHRAADGLVALLRDVKVVVDTGEKRVPPNGKGKGATLYRIVPVGDPINKTADAFLKALTSRGAK